MPLADDVLNDVAADMTDDMAADIAFLNDTWPN
jgi:hypothetical protein